MTFVRAATIDDLPAIRAFDEWKSATEAVVRAGTCYVAGEQAYERSKHPWRPGRAPECLSSRP